MLHIPVVGITMGDPAGIGPEIVCRSLNEEQVYTSCRPVVIGSREPLQQALDVLGLQMRIREITDPSEGGYDPGTINLFHIDLDYVVRPGILCADNGRVAIAYMQKAYDLLTAGKIDAIASAPCHKGAMKMAGSPYAGATELFAHFAGDKRTSTVVRQGSCYIFQLTTHLSLAQAIKKLTVDYISDFLISAVETMRLFGYSAPKVALSALNPHAGDNGALGTEEADILIPAIQKAEKVVGHIDGPIPADAIFLKGYDGTYDALIPLFHDTANIAIKLMDNIYPSVVITTGLPFIRTTVAHGTAYDIAYQGIAGHKKMLNCILAAAEISGGMHKEV